MLAWADKNEQKLIQALEHEIPSRKEENQSGDLDHATCSRKDNRSRKLKGAQERYLLPDLRKIRKHRDQANGFKS
jgi:hypothetical protein